MPTPLAGATIPRGHLVRAVGESYRQDALVSIVGGRAHHAADKDCLAMLVPEPTNEYDRDAVMVKIGGLHVAYLSREDARTYRPMVDAALRSYGAAVVEARICGGWDRGWNDWGHFGVELYLSDRAPVERVHHYVSVSNEEHYQTALRVAAGDTDLSTFTRQVLAELVEIEANPHAKKASGPVLEVRVDGACVGHLTPAMTARLQRMTARSHAEGKRLTCSGRIFKSDKPNGAELEVRLSACPQGYDEQYVIDSFFEIVVDQVLSTRSNTLHRIRSTNADGSARTMCGKTVAAGEAKLIASTKPWVADVEPDTRAVLTVFGDRCQRCDDAGPA